MIDAESPSGLCWHNGRPAGWVSTRGYWVTRVRGSVYKVHRVVLSLATEDRVDKLVDHIDRDKLNNSLDNLRWVSPSENIRNRKVRPGRKKTTTPLGASGVRWVYRRKSGRYDGRFSYADKMISCGTFDSVEEAALAVRRKRDELGCP